MKALPTTHPLPIFVKKLPLAQETTNNMVPLATFRPHQLWRQQHHPHCGHCTAAPSCTALCWGWNKWVRSNLQNTLLGTGSGSPPLPTLRLHHPRSVQEGNSSAAPTQTPRSSVTCFSITECLRQSAVCYYLRQNIERRF